ncbi:hypothetical protein [Streptomyces litchfieldiae]|uniref:NfeD-like C-terminal domain-containing protein n=1 Tax=Streptomyces litchfieldiae TaxID=3075543 RepID=A0ABU2MJ44_9ACTN|nr:hypothetical protein [Streptomyces sp. DSM 44938]MDT0341545.1 hypothetical protein [Streptomyces sp. DSM 44938]
MEWFLGLGIAGLVLLLLAVVFDGVLDGVLDLDGVLSLPAMAAFVSMLGFTGAVTLAATGFGAAGAAAVGVAAGGGTAWVVVRVSRALMRDQTGAAPRGSDLVGVSGAVVTPIPGGGGYGEVLLNVAGLHVKYSARSTRAVPAGAEVWVAGVLSATALEVREVER